MEREEISYNEDYQTFYLWFTLQKKWYNIENGQPKYTNSELYVSLSADAYLINWVWSMVAAPISAFRINKRIEENQASALMDDRLRLDPYLARNTRGLLLSLRF